MRWEDERESSNVEDVRGDSGGGGGFGGGGGGGGLGILMMLLPLLGRGGVGGIAILVVIGLFVFGGPLLRGGGQAPPQRAPSGYQGQSSTPGGTDAQAADLGFVKRIAAFTEDTWGDVFQKMGRTYTPAKFKIYRESYQTACGMGQSAMGPFYCPGDRTVYLDLSFFKELTDRFGVAPGEAGRFAEAYVVAHEVGHHVQNLLGQMRDGGMRGGQGGETRNETSVRTELQADCYAGVWAAQTNRLRAAKGKGFLDPGDLESGLKAAAAVGDDTLQRQARGRVVPDSFTHGSADQRTRWLRKGFDAGDIGACDTWSGSYESL